MRVAYKTNFIFFLMLKCQAENVFAFLKLQFGDLLLNSSGALKAKADV